MKIIKDNSELMNKECRICELSNNWRRTLAPEHGNASRYHAARLTVTSDKRRERQSGLQLLTSKAWWGPRTVHGLYDAIARQFVRTSVGAIYWPRESYHHT
ncbi:hypothetical protein EVAR_36160_1 [Eumeta japonica]|uniref:Uncharacterized protein n=1 Tax=Eumeta variegata TaxID=151549 RepID=A0A4C1X190_EUMVA|nr:hypothetical protein EVAR_36160_1 [Eumeta japonica]